MKIHTLLKNVKNKALIEQGMALVQQHLNTIGVSFTNTFSDTNKTFYGTPNVYVDSMGQKITSVVINPLDAFFAFSGINADLFLLVYNADDVSPRPTNPSTLGKTIQIPEFWYGTFPEVFAQFFLHELCHSKFQEFGRPDLTHNQSTSAYSQKTPIEYYLFLLKGLIPPNQVTPTPTPVPSPITKYKYFTEKEVKGLKVELVIKLDEARGYAGTPFIIESGLRSKEKNTAVGGVTNSAHLTGEAVDLRCANSNIRLKIVTGLIQAGFTRIGIGDNFVHADISKTLPQNVIWLY